MRKRTWGRAGLNCSMPSQRNSRSGPSRSRERPAERPSFAIRFGSSETTHGAPLRSKHPENSGGAHSPSGWQPRAASVPTFELACRREHSGLTHTHMCTHARMHTCTHESGRARGLSQAWLHVNSQLKSDPKSQSWEPANCYSRPRRNPGRRVPQPLSRALFCRMPPATASQRNTRKPPLCPDFPGLSSPAETCWCEGGTGILRNDPGVKLALRLSVSLGGRAPPQHCASIF